jgi:hypothetical protein
VSARVTDNRFCKDYAAVREHRPGEWVGGDFGAAGRPGSGDRADVIHSPAMRPVDVLKVDADEDGVGGDDAADALRYLVATKAREVRARKLRGI